MFQVGHQVLYGMHGVCTIIDVEERVIDHKIKQYFVLEPTELQGTRFYVPTRNQVALSKMRSIITWEELNSLLSSDEVQRDAWIPDENQRKQYYRDMMTSGDRAALVRMVHTLHRRKHSQSAAGRKLHLCDETFLRDAEKLLGSEFALVLDLPREQVDAYVRTILKDESE